MLILETDVDSVNEGPQWIEERTNSSSVLVRSVDSRSRLMWVDTRCNLQFIWSADGEYGLWQAVMPGMVRRT